MRRFGAAVAFGVLLATSACGGGGGTRPSEDELATALQKSGDSLLPGETGKVSEKAADCIAKILVDSRISDRALKAIVEGNKTFQPSKADQGAAAAVAPKIVKCLPSGLGDQ